MPRGYVTRRKWKSNLGVSHLADDFDFRPSHQIFCSRIRVLFWPAFTLEASPATYTIVTRSTRAFEVVARLERNVFHERRAWVIAAPTIVPRFGDVRARASPSLRSPRNDGSLREASARARSSSPPSMAIPRGWGQHAAWRNDPAEHVAQLEVGRIATQCRCHVRRTRCRARGTTAPSSQPIQVLTADPAPRSARSRELRFGRRPRSS